MRRTAPFLFALCAALGCATVPAPTPDVEGRVQRENDAIYYEQFGADSERAVVTLIHGGGVDRRVWDAQVEALAERYVVVRYDRRGYGQSSAPHEAYSDTADLIALLDELQLDATHLVASSAGAAVAIAAAQQHPDRVLSLALVGAALDGYRYPGRETELVDAIFRTARTTGVDAAAERWVSKPGMFAAYDPDDPGPRKLRELLLQNRQVFDFPWNLRERASKSLPLLPQISVPALVIVGREDTPDNRVLSDLLADRIPNCELAVVKDAGHMVHLERPGVFNDIVLDFLREVESR